MSEIRRPIYVLTVLIIGINVAAAPAAAAANLTTWEYSTGGVVASGVDIENGTAVVGSGDGNVYGIDTTDGSEQWSYDTGSYIQSGVAIQDETAVVGSGNYNIYGIDITDGSEKWSFSTGLVVDSGIAIENGTAVVGSQDDKIYGIDISDGTEQWSYTTGGNVESGVAIQDGTAVVGSDDNNIYGIDITDGSEQWSYTTGGAVRSGVAIQDGTAVVGSNDGNIYNIAISDGSEQWSYTTGGNMESGIAFQDGIAVAGSDNGNVYGIAEVVEATQGTGGQFDSPATIGVDVPPGSDAVEFVNAANGEVIERVDTPSQSESISWSFDESKRPQQWYARVYKNGGVEGETDIQVFNSLYNAQPNSKDIFSSPVNISVDVAGVESVFGGSATVRFYNGDGDLIGSDIIESSGTASIEYSNPVAGANQWYATVDGANGQTDTSANSPATFATPSVLELRNESSPNDLVTNSGEIEVRFFADESGEVISKTTTDGTISMSGLPAGEPLVASVNVDGYYARTVAIDSILEQQRLFMLPDSEDVSQVDWVLNDESGQFEATDTTLFVERPLEINGTTEYRVVVGERFGGTGRFASQLRTDDRYRLRIVNSDGDSRILGSYTAAGPAQETLTVGSIGFPGVNDSGTAFQANINDDDAVLEYKYVDERSATDNLDVEIRRDNETIYSASTVGPIRTARERVPLSTLNHSEGDSYTVAYEADRGGSTISGDRVVGDIRDIAQDWNIDGRILDALGYLTVIALFGATVILSPRHAGIVGSSVAMALSLIGVIAVNQILIGFALVVSALFAVGGGR